MQTINNWKELEDKIKNKLIIFAVPANNFDINKFKSHPDYSNETSGIYTIVSKENSSLFQYNEQQNVFYFFFSEKDRESYDFTSHVIESINSVGGNGDRFERNGPVLMAYHYADSIDSVLDFVFYLNNRNVDLFRDSDYNLVGSQTIYTFERPGKPYDIAINISQPKSDAIIFEINVVYKVNIINAKISEVIYDIKNFINKETNLLFEKLYEIRNNVLLREKMAVL
ncbi:MAG: hypothetical protein QXF12_00505 [Candidatus Aenigmatarchaeota archaeon]